MRFPDWLALPVVFAPMLWGPTPLEVPPCLPDDGEVCFTYDPALPSVAVPQAWAERAPAIIQCESGWDTTAVGKLGERGLAQIHPTHRPAMAAAGLDFGRERDRIRWAVRLWERQGWEAWGCRNAGRD